MGRTGDPGEGTGGMWKEGGVGRGTGEGGRGKKGTGRKLREMQTKKNISRQAYGTKWIDR